LRWPIRKGGAQVLVVALTCGSREHVALRAERFHQKRQRENFVDKRIRTT